MKSFPQAGDGIVITSDKTSQVAVGACGIIRSVNTRGTHALVDDNPHTHPNDILSVDADMLLRAVFYPHGKMTVRKTIAVGEYRQETFLEYLTRPTGFGKMRWEAFVFLQAIFLIGGIVQPRDDWWMVGVAYLAVNGVLVLGSYMNFTRRWV
jgi:hypothetical protein